MIAKGKERRFSIRASRPSAKRTHRCSFVRLLAVFLPTLSVVSLATWLAAPLPDAVFLAHVQENDARLFLGDEGDGRRGRHDAGGGRRRGEGRRG